MCVYMCVCVCVCVCVCAECVLLNMFCWRIAVAWCCPVCAGWIWMLHLPCLPDKGHCALVHPQCTEERKDSPGSMKDIRSLDGPTHRGHKGITTTLEFSTRSHTCGHRTPSITGSPLICVSTVRVCRYGIHAHAHEKHTHHGIHTHVSRTE